MVKINVDKGLFSALNKAQKMDDVKRVVTRNGAELQQKMMRNASFTKGYQTGTTKRSITMTGGDGGLSVTVMPTTSYSVFLEYGTRFMSSQSFVKPSFYKQRPIFINDLRQLVK